jgi:NAD-dependent DNA ligase
MGASATRQPRSREEGLGERTVSLFLDHDLIRDPADIYTLTGRACAASRVRRAS